MANEDHVARLKRSVSEWNEWRVGVVMPDLDDLLRDRSHWGGTYNKEMKQLRLLHAFRFVNIAERNEQPGRFISA